MPLDLLLHALPEGSHALQLSEPASDLDILLPEGDALTENVYLDLRIEARGPELICMGVAHAPLSGHCTRCWDLIETELVGEMAFVLVRTERPQDEEADDDYEFVSAHALVYPCEDRVRETLTLAEPMARYCRPDCKGRCPKCFVNWNREACDCTPVLGDSRWEGLRNLLGDA